MHAQSYGYDGSIVEKPSFVAGIGRKVAISFLRQPVQSSGLIVMGLASMTIMANALYMQPGMHPAPLFSKKSPHQIAAIEPLGRTALELDIPSVTPVFRPEKIAAPKKIAKAPALKKPLNVDGLIDLSDPQGNVQTFEFQTLLAAMGFFTQKRDGYYGPDTATAIRAFQAKQGLKLTGKLSDGLKVQLYLALPGMIAANKAQKLAQIQTAPHPVLAVRPTLAPAEQAVAPQVAAIEPLAAPLAIPVMDANVAAAVAQVAKIVADEISEQVASELTAIAPEKHAVRTVATRQILIAPEAEAPTSVAAEPKTALAQTMPAPVEPAETPRALVENIQKGLWSLGYLNGYIKGMAGDETFAAIREFENYNRFPITGEISAHMLTLLIVAGADIS